MLFYLHDRDKDLEFHRDYTFDYENTKKLLLKTILDPYYVDYIMRICMADWFHRFIYSEFGSQFTWSAKDPMDEVRNIFIPCLDNFFDRIDWNILSFPLSSTISKSWHRVIYHRNWKELSNNFVNSFQPNKPYFDKIKQLCKSPYI